MTGTDDITPGERREIKSIVRGQFKVLLAEVERRKEELKGEVESELLRQYRAQDDALAEAQQQVARANSDHLLALQKIAADLKEQRPELKVAVSGSYGRGLDVNASDPNRAQAHAALLAAIPNQVGDAKLKLARQEMDLLRDLSVGALKSEQARAFLASIPTVGELVPRVRLAELENESRL